VELVLVKSPDRETSSRGTMVPSGKRHSPTSQHGVLIFLVTHTREEPGSEKEVNTPISAMSRVSPGRYTIPFNVKYKPELGGPAMIVIMIMCIHNSIY